MSFFKKLALSILVAGTLGICNMTSVFASVKNNIVKAPQQTNVVNKRPSNKQPINTVNNPVNEAATIKKIEKQQLNVTHVTFKQYGNNIKRTYAVTPVKLTSLLKSKKTYYLFFGFRSCPYCRNFSKTLSKFMKQSKTRTVYYVNIENFGSDLNPNSTMYKDLQNFIEKKVVLKTTPTIVAMKGNKMMGSFRDSRTSLKQLQNLNVKLIKSK